MQQLAQLHITLEHTYQVHFLGRFRFLHNKQCVAESVWKRRKTKTLLKWLLLNRDVPQSAERIIHLFWPEESREVALRNLYIATHYLRRLIEPTLFPHQPSSYLHRNKNNGYWLEIDDAWWVDIVELQKLELAACRLDRAGFGLQAIPYYRQIITQYKQGFLPEDAYDDVFSLYRHKYDYLYQNTLKRIIHLYSHYNMLEDILLLAHEIWIKDPSCELAALAVAHSYFKQGNILRAHQTLEDFHHMLNTELFMEPSDEFTALRNLIKQEG